MQRVLVNLVDSPGTWGIVLALRFLGGRSESILYFTGLLIRDL